MKNKERVKDKGRKIKTIAGKPISAFVAYSRKRKDMEIAARAKKIKKNHVQLADILAGNASTAESITNRPLANQNLLTTDSQTKKKKKKKSKDPLKNYKSIISNGDSTSPEVMKPTKKLAKPKTSPKKRLNDESPDSTGIEYSVNKDTPEEDQNFEVSEIEESAPKLVTETIQVQSKKVKNKPEEETEFSMSSSQTEITNGSSLDQSSENCLGQSVEDDDEETIPNILSNNPMEEGKSLFEWLISPLSIDDFFKNNWERAPLHIKRSKARYYKLLMSTPMLDTILRDFYVLYTKNIDITSYSNGQRETHNPHGRARPSVVWDYYSNGCSIRMLNPQTFIPRLHTLNAMLQEYFGCFVGANSYLTPPDSQGFAPHYDDIEAFIIQIEGKKRWRLYKPTTEAEYLPRYSSKNFDPSEIGEPILDTVVNAGDLLYFPRGTIHQGETIDGTHSLHITLSVYQKNSWCDFLEKLIPDAVNRAVQSDSLFREGLPLDYLRHVGIVHSKKDSDVRRNFIEKTKDLLHKLIDHIDVDKVADQMAKTNIHDFLPPVLSPQEQECSILQDGERMTTAGLVENRVEIEPDTRIRLLRSHCIRLVEEEDSMRIYYSTENSKEYHEYEAQFLEVEKELAPAIEEIIRCYPHFIRVDDLPIEGEDNRVQVARDLWEKCIVVTDVPLPIVD